MFGNVIPGRSRIGSPSLLRPIVGFWETAGTASGMVVVGRTKGVSLQIWHARLFEVGGFTHFAAMILISTQGCASRFVHHLMRYESGTLLLEITFRDTLGPAASSRSLIDDSSELSTVAEILVSQSAWGRRDSSWTYTN